MKYTKNVQVCVTTSAGNIILSQSPLPFDFMLVTYAMCHLTSCFITQAVYV